jgi:8-oxo-dGTP diphosphatase
MPNIAPEAATAVYTHVAVAAIVNGRRRVLVSLRPRHVHQGGLWEFPGGKLEAGESVTEALDREIQEELGVRPVRKRPLIRIPHQYPDRSVLLDVWKVDAFAGEPQGREGQALEWVDIDGLAPERFPAANAPIIRALQLPDRYLITPEPHRGGAAFLRQLRASLEEGVALVQLRVKSLEANEYMTLAHQVVDLCHARGAKVLLNGAPERALAAEADGVHLDGSRLAGMDRRPLPSGLWVAASCHSPEDLARAQRLGVDFAVLSPVQATASHPEAAGLGWQKFAEWVDHCIIPVYALGGMDVSDIDIAARHGGQGVAAIRALWARVR